jgi:15-cis-phytoene synthase
MSESVSQATAVCRQSITQHSKSFALASLLLPQHSREATYAIYAWCRRADDAVDELRPEEQLQAWSRLGQELDALYEGALQTDPVLSSFQTVTLTQRIPKLYPAELLAGMAMDANAVQYARWDELLQYCYRVASTVGLMMCHVLGVRHVAALRHAAHLGIAMQLTNICRDVQEDWQRGRLYLPDELLSGCGADGLRGELNGPLPQSAREPLRKALREVLGAAALYYESADEGLVYLTRRSAFAVSAARGIYSEIGSELAKREHDVFAPRAVVPHGRKLVLCAKAAWQIFTQSQPHRLGGAFIPTAEMRYGPDLLAI